MKDAMMLRLLRAVLPPPRGRLGPTPGDPAAHRARIELYRRRAECGLEVCTGRRPSAPERGRSTAWLRGELAALETWLAEEATLEGTLAEDAARRTVRVRYERRARRR